MNHPVRAQITECITGVRAMAWQAGQMSVPTARIERHYGNYDREASRRDSCWDTACRPPSLISYSCHLPILQGPRKLRPVRPRHGPWER